LLFGFAPFAGLSTHDAVEVDNFVGASVVVIFGDFDNIGVVGEGGMAVALMKKRNVAPCPSMLSTFEQDYSCQLYKK